VGGPRDGERRLRVTPLLGGDLPEVYDADRWSFGTNRSALIRATLNLHSGWGLVALDASGSIKGCLIRSVYQAGTRIGPFVAEATEVARSLLACALSSLLTDSGSSFVEVSVPGRNTAHSVLREFGFAGRLDRLRVELVQAPSTKGLEVYGTTHCWLHREPATRLAGHLISGGLLSRIARDPRSLRGSGSVPG
jgi:hypothetical protein